MRKIFFVSIFLLVLNFTLKAQIPQEPNTYGYNFKRVGADSLLWIPKDTLQVPSWGVGKTHIARKGTTLYYWDGTKWSAISGSGGTYTAGNGLTLSGSQFKLGSPLTENTTITTTGYDFNLPGIPTVSSTTRRKVVLIDTVTGKVERIDPSTINSNIYNTDGTIPGQRVVTIPDGSELQFFLDVTGKFNVTNDAGDTIIYALGNSGLFLPSVPTVSSTTGRKVALIDTTTGKVEKIDPATLVTTPTLQQVLTAGSTLTKNDTIYLNSYYLRILNNGAEYLVIDPTLNNEYAEFRSYNPTEVNDARLKVNTTNLLSNGQFEADFGDGVNVSRVDLQSSSGVSKVILNAYNDGGGLNESYLYVDLDSIYLRPEKGALNIDSLRTWSGISDTTYKKPMTWDTRNGRWEYAANWYGGGGGGTVSSASGTGVSLVNGSSQIKRLKEGTGITITDNTDSVTINRVTDSTVVRNLRWKYRNTFELMDEFLGNGVAPGWSSQSSGAGSSAGTSDFLWADLDTTWQGATYASTGTTTTGKGLGMYGNASSSNTGSFRGYNTSFAVYETRVRFDTLSNATNEYAALFGWMDWFGSSFYQKGMKFVYDRATYGDYWVLRSDDGGTSAVVTTSSVAAKTDYVLRIEVYNWQMGSSGGSIKAYINDVEVVASSGTYPIVSNIAKTDAFYPCYWIQKSAGTVARKVFLDWVYQYAEFIKRL